MTLIESLLSGISVAVAVAAITAVTSHFVRKSRIYRALLADIHLHISGVREAEIYLTKLFEEQVEEGKKLTFDGRHYFGRYTLYESLQAELVHYLKRDHLIRVIEIYHRFWELESSISGLISLGETS